jgi:transposase
MIDLGIKTLATCSDGAIYENPKVLNIKIEDFLAQQIYRKIK